MRACVIPNPARAIVVHRSPTISSAVAVAKDWAQRESVEAIVLAVEGMATYIHNFGERVSVCCMFEREKERGEK